MLKHGHIDAIIERKDLNEKIGNLLSILLKSNELKTIDEESEQNRELIKKTATST